MESIPLGVYLDQQAVNALLHVHDWLPVRETASRHLYATCE